MGLACRGPLLHRLLTMEQASRLALFLLSVYGLANAIAVLKAGKPVRFLAALVPPRYPGRDHCGTPCARTPLLDLVSCPACLGFWIGGLLSYTVFSPTAFMLGVTGLRGALVDGFAALAFCWIVHVILCRLGALEL